MSAKFCYNNGYRGTRPVLPWYKSFKDQGKVKRYTALNGSFVVSKIIGFTTSGPGSFLNGRKFYFPDDDQINNNKVVGIELISSTQLVKNPTFPQTETNDSAFAFGYLVIVDVCNNEILRVPLTMLNKQTNGGKPAFFNLKDVLINNCYIQFNGAVGISQANSFYFNFFLDPK